LAVCVYSFSVFSIPTSLPTEKCQCALTPPRLIKCSFFAKMWYSDFRLSVMYSYCL
jgi:hypothetical protein